MRRLICFPLAGDGPIDFVAKCLIGQGVVAGSVEPWYSEPLRANPVHFIPKRSYGVGAFSQRSFALHPFTGRRGRSRTLPFGAMKRY